MKRREPPSKEAFDKLLLWFDPDREKAAKRYQTIQFRLIRVFAAFRSEEHTSELQSRDVISYAVFCLNDTATTEIYTLTNTLSLHDALPI